MKKKQYLSFERTRKFVHSLKLKNQKEWVAFAKTSKKPKDMPADVRGVYKNEWVSWGDWLGTGYVYKKNFKNFEEAKRFTQNQNIQNQKEWRIFSKTSKFPNDISKYPDEYYKKKWISWGDWLGTGRIANQNKTYLPFEDAKIKSRQLAKKHNIKNRKEWKDFTELNNFPSNLPKAPDIVYKNKGWKNLGDWLGSGYIATTDRTYLPFKEARKYAITLNLKSKKEWVAFAKTSKKPKDMPADVSGVYKKEWKGWGDWLGTGEIATFDRAYLSFEDAKIKSRQLAKKHDIKNQNDWIKAHREGKIPNNLPANPWHVYSKKKDKLNSIRRAKYGKKKK